VRFDDWSDYQEGASVDAYADAGGRLLALKASEGASWQSATMPAWRQRARDRGVFVWLYHFLHGNSTEAEVANFLDAIGGGLWDNEAAVCDYEAEGLGLADMGDRAIPGGAGATPMGAYLREHDARRAATTLGAPTALLGTDSAQGWMAATDGATARLSILYSGGYYLDERDTAGLVRWPLWVAGYGSDDGDEHPWPATDRWSPFQYGPGDCRGPNTIGWQFTSRGWSAGYDAPHDVNRFDGSEADLARICGGGPPAPPAPPAPAPADPLHLDGATLLRNA